jgi:hypothetical protein
MMDAESYFNIIRRRVYILCLVATWLMYETWGKP